MPFPKTGPVTAREAADLPNGGAYDDAGDAIVVDCKNFSSAIIGFNYTPADNAGQLQFKVLYCPIKGGTFRPLTIDDGSINATGNASYSNVYVSEKRFPASALGTEVYYSYKIDVTDIRLIKVLCCEAGAPGTPGEAFVDVCLGGSEE
jgi:hypothetical protein